MLDQIWDFQSFPESLFFLLIHLYFSGFPPPKINFLSVLAVGVTTRLDQGRVTDLVQFLVLQTGDVCSCCGSEEMSGLFLLL